MDPVTHTLVGAALAETGLKRRTGLGTATLLIGANLPDVDVLAYIGGPTFALTARRGWTHGVLALVVLPLVLTAAIVWWDSVTRHRRPDREPVAATQVLLLGSLAIATHPVLDFLNVYGLRWLMPFDDRWFYGDVLFIVDPWVWTVLAAGVLLARRTTGHPRAALGALACTAAYVALMGASMLAARQAVRRDVPADQPVRRMMVAPVAVNPFRKWVVLDQDDRYRVGGFSWFGASPFRYADLTVLSRRDDQAAVRAVATVPDMDHFLYWARFPFFVVESRAGLTMVHAVDARYAVDPEASFGALTVEAERK